MLALRGTQIVEITNRLITIINNEMKTNIPFNMNKYKSCLFIYLRLHIKSYTEASVKRTLQKLT